MEVETEKKLTIRGGEFLIRESEASEVFIPEEFSEEQLMIADTCSDFLKAEIWDRLDELDKAESPELIASLMDKAGELGLLGIAVPEAYGGFGMSFNTSMLVTERTGAGHSFSVALSAHTGIGTLPIVYYGNEEQKQQYLPRLASGEWKSAYCLTEPDSGSDANAAKTRAVLNAEGTHYVLSGQKMWITNGGFADLFIVFAKITDENGQPDKNLSAFIVEKSFGGITMNPAEHKMGIKGSDTRQLFFNDCLVPVSNLLSDRGNGFKIAVNILNVGRIKLAAAALGGAKKVVDAAVSYASERKQFGVAIASFGAIQYKLAEMVTRIFASESAAYRAGQHIDDLIATLKASGTPDAQAKLKALEEFAIECALMKVHGSETLDYVVDEGVQIYGGMGYSADAPMDRAYRDSRINRIFEGTNEINRLLTVDMLLKRALKGQLDLMGPAMAVSKEILSIPDFGSEEEEGLFSTEKKVIRNLKKAVLMVAGAAVQKFMLSLSDEQEIIMDIADMGIEVYVAESVLLRVEKLTSLRGEEQTAIQRKMAILYLQEAIEKVARSGRSAITSFAEADELRVMLMGLKRFTKAEPVNLKQLRREIAGSLIAANQYPF